MTSRANSRAKLHQFDDQLMDAEKVLLNPLNTSTSKQQFSFPRAQRWQRSKTQTDQYKFYDIPTTKSKITTTIGSSKRDSLSKQSMAPAPNQYDYNVEGQFGIKARKSSKGFVFGLGRNELKNNSFLNLKTEGPSPQSYNIPAMPHKQFTFSRQKRLKTEGTPATQLGPGSYQAITSLLIEDKQILSNQPRHGSPKIHEKKIDSRRRTQRTTPPLYNPRVTTKGENLQMVKKRGYRIGTSKRSYPNTTYDYPGPGRYKMFSEFLSKGKC